MSAGGVFPMAGAAKATAGFAVGAILTSFMVLSVLCLSWLVLWCAAPAEDKLRYFEWM